MTDEVAKTPGAAAEETADEPNLGQTVDVSSGASVPDSAGASASAPPKPAGAAADAVVADPELEAEAGESGAAFLGSVVEGSAAAAATPPPGEGERERVADPQLKAIIEALVFASPEPLTPKMLFKLLESEPKEDVELAVQSLSHDYEGRGGLQLIEVAGGYQIVTRPEMHEWVRRLFHERKTQKLSVQALETLAVIAYKQPVTGPEVAEIRGVNTAGVLSTLLERHLIKIAGRKAVVGRPFLYATTREFLIRFGLRDLSDLPKVEDLADVLGFEPPAGLADSGPSEGRLPLDLDGEGGGAPEGDDLAEGEGKQIH